MKREKYEKLRNIFREYRLLENELNGRSEYIAEFKKIMIYPLPNTEVNLRKIYTALVEETTKKALKLKKRLKVMEDVIERLDGAERNVMYFRYIKGISWIDMPEYMMYEQRTCQVFEVKALEKILKMNIDWGDKNVK